MRLCYLTRGGVTDGALVTALKQGMLRCGDDLAWAQGDDDPLPAGCDGVAFFGIAMRTRRLMFAKAPLAIMFDKGYARGKTGTWRAPDRYFRVSVNDDQPLAYFQRIIHPDDRWRRLGIELRPCCGWSSNVFDLLVDGASIKFCAWKELGYVELWGEHVAEKIRTVAPHAWLTYRPRPDGRREPIVPRGRGYDAVDHGDYEAALRSTGCVVTYGGNMGFDAIIRGLPVFAIDNSIARPLAETDWMQVAKQRVPSEVDRLRWCADVAYCQWTLDEIASGEMWDLLKEEIRYL